MLLEGWMRGIPNRAAPPRGLDRSGKTLSRRQSTMRKGRPQAPRGDNYAFFVDIWEDATNPPRCLCALFYPPGEVKSAENSRYNIYMYPNPVPGLAAINHKKRE